MTATRAIQCEFVRAIPDEVLDNLSKEGERQVRTSRLRPQQLTSFSDKAVVLRADKPLMALGIMKFNALASNYEIWMLATRWLTLKHLRPMRELLIEHLPANTIARTRSPSAERFARLFGFIPQAYVDGHIISSWRPHYGN